jgi:hypothetical protein
LFDSTCEIVLHRNADDILGKQIAAQNGRRHGAVHKRYSGEQRVALAYEELERCIGKREQGVGRPARVLGAQVGDERPLVHLPAEFRRVEELVDEVDRSGGVANRIAQAAIDLRVSRNHAAIRKKMARISGARYPIPCRQDFITATRKENEARRRLASAAAQRRAKRLTSSTERPAGHRRHSSWSAARNTAPAPISDAIRDVRWIARVPP